jgi:hypothetical protein
VPRALICIVVAAVGLGANARADACIFYLPQPIQRDVAHAEDQVPPSRVDVVARVTHPEDEPDSEGCSRVKSSCPRHNYIMLALHATDDRTSGDRLGYHVRFLGGSAPRGLKVTDGPLVPEGSNLVLWFDIDDDGDFEIDLDVRAVDLNGNYGPPTVITVGYSEGLGCQAAVGARTLPVCLALAWVLRRRRRT